MSFEPVDFYVVDTTPLALPIPGTVVKVYSQDGKQVFGQQTTDVNGVSSFMLPSDIPLQVRFYKQQVLIKNPQYLTVLQAPLTNSFTITGELFTLPASTDPRLCMCYGFFRNIAGAPASNLDIQIIAIFDPLLLDGAGVLTERVTVRTDSKGYVEVPLIRNGQYGVVMEGFEDKTRTISVPDQLNVNLPDLIFPVVGSVSFDPPGPYSIPLGSSLTITPTVMATDGENLGLGTADVTWTADDQSIVSVSPIPPSTLILAGRVRGSTVLRATRNNRTIIRIPDPGILGNLVPITIT